MNALKPLHDDVSGSQKTRFQRIVVKLFGDVYLSRSLKTQLAQRPKTWGLGLWPDIETERVAKICAECLSQNFGCRDDKLIPDDPLDLIVAIDPSYYLDDFAVIEIMREFDCDLDPTSYQGGTFGDLVKAVMEARGQKGK